MKKLFILFLLLGAASAFSQQGSRPAKKPVGGAAGTQMVYTTDHDTCLNKKFSIVFYAIQDSVFNLNVNAITTVSIPVIIDTLNARFARICVSFESCSLKVIPNYEYNDWSTEVDDVVTTNWYTPNTINVYFTESISAYPASELNGYVHTPTNVYGARLTNRDVVVVKGGQSPLGLSKTILHLFGHFFGLHDTYGEVGPPATPPPLYNFITHEFADRSNCAVNGDQICDTEADPYPISYYDILPPPGTYCQYFPDIKDGKSYWYTPPVDNLMSMYSCRCRFSQQQYNKMARYILTTRNYLH